MSAAEQHQLTVTTGTEVKWNETFMGLQCIVVNGKWNSYSAVCVGGGGGGGS